MEEGLSCGVEVQAIRCSLVRQLVARECLDLGEELAGLDEHASQRLKVFEAFAVLQQWGFGPSHLKSGTQRSATREEELGACREQADERCEVARALREVGTQRDLRELTYGELAIDLEAAHALDFVIEEVQTVGELGGKGIDVDDAPTQGELPRLIDVVHALEAPSEELVTQVVTLDDVPPMDDEGLFLRATLLGDTLHEGLGIGDEDG